MGCGSSAPAAAPPVEPTAPGAPQKAGKKKSRNAKKVTKREKPEVVPVEDTSLEIAAEKSLGEVVDIMSEDEAVGPGSCTGSDSEEAESETRIQAHSRGMAVRRQSQRSSSSSTDVPDMSDDEDDEVVVDGAGFGSGLRGSSFSEAMMFNPKASKSQLPEKETPASSTSVYASSSSFVSSTRTDTGSTRPSQSREYPMPAVETEEQMRPSQPTEYPMPVVEAEEQMLVRKRREARERILEKKKREANEKWKAIQWELKDLPAHTAVPPGDRADVWNWRGKNVRVVEGKCAAKTLVEHGSGKVLWTSDLERGKSDGKMVGARTSKEDKEKLARPRSEGLRPWSAEDSRPDSTMAMC